MRSASRWQQYFQGINSLRILLTTLLLLLTGAAPVGATDFSELFARVSPSVVVVHTRAERETSGDGRVEHQGIGSGVLIDLDLLGVESKYFYYRSSLQFYKFQTSPTLSSEIDAALSQI